MHFFLRDKGAWKNGAAYQSYSYDAWGKVTARDASGSVIPSSAISAPWLFTGRRFDNESGLYHYRARTYSAELGRFLQMDPIKFDAGDPNIFRYVGNDPINLTDPMGLWQFTMGGGIGGFGGSITFGNNGGQWNAGAYGGLGSGLFGSFDLADSGCHKKGTDWGFNADGSVGLEENVNASVHIGNGSKENPDSAEIGITAPGTSLQGNVKVEGGKLSFGNPKYSGGGGASIGFGGTHFF